MKQPEPEHQQESLYLELPSSSASTLPLHTSISLFLLSYCQCRSFRVLLVSPEPPGGGDGGGDPSPAPAPQSWSSQVPDFLGASEARAWELPALVRTCRLPAVLDQTGRYCRAGLAVVLRHVVARTVEADPGRRDAAALLGFKNTCLKACAEVSQWTRLCELAVPAAVEALLLRPDDQSLRLPAAILRLERRLAEPVKVHNDDKIRRQKLQQQQQKKKKKKKEEEGEETGSDPQEEVADPQAPPPDPSHGGGGLELRAALAKLSVGGALPPAATRERPEIRKVKTAELPALEHVFAEGLYFTLTDVVLLPCVHRYLSCLSIHGSSSLLSQLPLLLRWYVRVQEVPGVTRAARACGLDLSAPPAPPPGPSPPAEEPPLGGEAEPEGPGTGAQTPFVGGPRPTMTKLKESGIEAVFSPHPRPSWTLPWDRLPAAVNPTEGKMSDVRALRKRQQFNNLVAMVTELARPGQTVVDFCSGGGHVGIAVAYSLPDCQVILIENKEESLTRARSRTAELGLTNLGFIQANLDYFTGSFHVGVALHACGVATDMVVGHCVQARAAFVVSPCCYGFIQNTVKFTFPRSTRFQETLSCKEHMLLCRFADQTAAQLPPERRLIGKQCMGLVDLDRSWAAEAHGYSVRVMTMQPESCSPKNNMLVGVAREADAASE